jgi:hypothetical protein
MKVSNFSESEKFTIKKLLYYSEFLQISKVPLTGIIEHRCPFRDIYDKYSIENKIIEAVDWDEHFETVDKKIWSNFFLNNSFHLFVYVTLLPLFKNDFVSMLIKDLGIMYLFNDDIKNINNIIERYFNSNVHPLVKSLKKVFAELNSKDWFASINFSCCDNCYWSEIEQNYPKKMNLSVFYDALDKMYICFFNSIYLSYSPNMQEEDMNCLLHLFGQYQIKYNWSGDRSEKIKVYVDEPDYQIIDFNLEQ